MLPIVLIHGFPFDHTLWQAQVDYLQSPAGGGHFVLTPDLPGFGRAPGELGKDETIERYAAFIHQFIRDNCHGKAIVGGFSLGGYVLLALLRDHPETVAAALFIDTRADTDTPAARDARLKTIESMESQGAAAMPAFLDAMLPRLLGKRPSPAAKTRTRAIMEKQTPSGIISAQSAMLKRRDQSDLLPDLSLPVLIVVGAEDTITPPSVALGMQNHMPHAMVAQIVASGHMSPVEQPDAVNAAIHAFLATLPKEQVTQTSGVH